MWSSLLKPLAKYPWLARVSYKTLGTDTTHKLISHTVYPIFCGSSDPVVLGQQINKLAVSNIKTILHLALEDHRLYCPDKYCQTLFEVIPLLQRDDMVAIKLTGLVDRELLIKNQNVSEKVIPLIRPIVSLCANRQLAVTIDAEETNLEEAVRDVTRRLMCIYNRDQAIVYQTYQCYLHTTEDRVLEDLELSKSEGFYLGAKLVRGAYLEWESKRPDPKVWSNIEFTAHCYNRIAEKLMPELGSNLILATHNDKAVRHLSTRASQMQIKPKFAQLLGLNDKLTHQLANDNQIVYKFVPFGPIDIVLPYLLRRLEETKLANHVN